jgi:hypothetical protein
MKHGDFTTLADACSKYQPGYSEKVLDAMIGMLLGGPGESDFVDVGAGTGIWTRMVANKGFRCVYAVEPNCEIRKHGVHDK